MGKNMAKWHIVQVESNKYYHNTSISKDEIN